MNWRNILRSAGSILGLTLGLTLFFLLDSMKGYMVFNSPIYKNLAGVSGREVFLIDQSFNRFFIVVMFIIVAVGFSFLTQETIPNDPNNPIQTALSKRFGDKFSVRHTRFFPRLGDAVIVSLICWLASIPLSLFVWGATFSHHNALWTRILLSGVIGTPIVVLLSGALDKFLISSTRNNNMPNIDLMGTDDQTVIGIMGIPIQIFKAGAKVIYVYKNVKIIFTDGKVADVQ